MVVQVHADAVTAYVNLTWSHVQASGDRVLNVYALEIFFISFNTVDIKFAVF